MSDLDPLPCLLSASLLVLLLLTLLLCPAHLPLLPPSPSGCVSYVEFLLLLTLVGIPKDDVSVIFDILDEDCSGT